MNVYVQEIPLIGNALCPADSPVPLQQSYAYCDFAWEYPFIKWTVRTEQVMWQVGDIFIAHPSVVERIKKLLTQDAPRVHDWPAGGLRGTFK